MKLGSVANDAASSGLISPHITASQHNAARECALGAMDEKLRARKIRKQNTSLMHSESIGDYGMAMYRVP